MTNDVKKSEDARIPPAIEATVVAAVGAAWGVRWKILAGIGGLLLTAAGLGYFAAGRVAEAAVREAAFSEYVKALSKDDDFRKAVAGVSGAPVGSVVAWPSLVAPPDGWAVCDGTEIDAKSDDRISVVLGATYGAAPNGKVKLPDFRGYFLRGSGERHSWNGVAQGGASAEIGSPQAPYASPLDMSYWQDGAASPLLPMEILEVGVLPSSRGAYVVAFQQDARAVGSIAAPRPNSSRSTPPNLETRPANYAVHWIIRVR